MRACVRVCAGVYVCNISYKRGAASTNLTTSVYRACPELKLLALAVDAQPIKLVA